MSATRGLAERLGPELRQLRRRLHAAPEVGLHNPRTQERILGELEGLDLEVATGTSLSSVVALLRGRGPTAGTHRPVVLLRADTDALPVTEETDVAWRSTVEGIMHACGHDLHVAALVGAARVLHALRDELVGDVIFMFQPGEEGPGGAALMVDEGLLEAAGRPVDAAYALHVIAAEEPHGVWYGRPGATMAAADEVLVTVRGRGGHGSAPHRTLDPVPVACEIVLALQTMVTRRFDVFDPVVVTVGQITAGTRANVIADTAVIEATVRTFSDAAREAVLADLRRVAEGVAGAHGLVATVETAIGYPVTINDPGEFAFAKGVLVDLFGGERWADMAFPEAGSEDMSVVLREVPGAYLYVSATPVGMDPEAVDDNHSPRALFDDAIVPDMAQALAELALRRCLGVATGTRA